MNDTFQRKLRQTWVCKVVWVWDKSASYSGKRFILLLHDTKLKPGRQSTAGSFNHAEGERLRHEQRSYAFPRLRYRIDFDREQLVGRLAILSGDKDYLPTLAVALLREFNSEFCASAKSENDGDVRGVHI